MKRLDIDQGQVKANRGVPGVDQIPIDDFMAFAHENWSKIRSSVFAGTYKPLPIKRVEIPKATEALVSWGFPPCLIA